VHTTKAPASPWVIGRAHFYRKAVMKSLVAVGLVLSLTGCATPPQWLANHFNSLDPCQNVNSQPSWCGAGAGRTVIYSTPHQQPLGAQIGYTKNR
jgi:starvation-inducible outer membrane lipoprotein